MPGYADRLHLRCQELDTAALVGLDPRWDLLPSEIQEAARRSGRNNFEVQASAFRTFCCEIIDVVASQVPAVKPQVAFFEKLGPAGMEALRAVIEHARTAGLIVIADAKRGDIGSTAQAYADAWMAGEDPGAAPYAADALTVNAYLGADTLQPFVEAAATRGAGIYVLVRTSNPGAAVFQDLVAADQKVFESVGDVVEQLNEQHWPDAPYGGVGAVVGATWPQELKELRERMPKSPLLIPGYGSQGGTAADVMCGLDANGTGALVNSSRAINFAYRSEEYSDQFDPDQWREAIDAATRGMIADLRR